MAEYWGLPLALIFEEILQSEPPEQEPDNNETAHEENPNKRAGQAKPKPTLER